MSERGGERAGILARVSAQNQADNTSTDEQLRRGREYCAAKGYTVAAERTEVMSGTFVLARSTFNELLTLAADGALTVIVVDIPDRLGRGDVIAKLELMTQLNGARIEYAQPGRDTSTVGGFIQHSAEQMVSGIERLNIGRRMSGGRYARARQGRVIAGPNRPYGYRYARTYDDMGHKLTSTLEIVEDEARVIRNLFEWMAYEQLTTYQITRRLQTTGVPTLGQIDGRTQKGKPTSGVWKGSTIYTMLTNRVYKGEWVYGKRQFKRVDTAEGIRMELVRMRDESETVVVPVPAIVSAELWEAAQVQLGANRQRFVKPTRYQYLLRGRIRCANCGRTYTGHTRQYSYGSRRSYQCQANAAQQHTQRCNSRHIAADIVEGIVWQGIVDAMLDEERLFSGLARRRTEAERSADMIRQTLHALDEANAKDAAAINRLIRMQAADDTATDEDLRVYAAEMGKLRRAMNSRTTERAGLAAKLETALTPESEAEIRRLQAEIAARLRPEGQEVAFEDKLKLIELLNIECVFDSETREIAVTGLVGRITLLSTTRRDEQYARFSFVAFVPVAPRSSANNVVKIPIKLHF